MASAGERSSSGEEPGDEAAPIPVVVTSSATGAGLRELVDRVFETMPESAPEPEEAALSELPEHRVFRPAADRGWAVERAGEGAWRVTGQGIERLIARHDLSNDEALEYIERRLRSLGVLEALRSRGFAPGEDVEIAGVVFELDPEE